MARGLQLTRVNRIYTSSHLQLHIIHTQIHVCQLIRFGFISVVFEVAYFLAPKIFHLFLRISSNRDIVDSREHENEQRYYYIRLSEKFLSFYKEITDAERFLFYSILSNYVRSILLCWDKHSEISQTWFHVCTKVHCCKKHVCERKTLFGQPNTSATRSVSAAQFYGT